MTTDLPEIPDDKLVWITDNDAARKFLAEFGLLHRLESVPSTHGVMTASRRDHPTHWILGISDPETNGFSVYGWPKSKFTEKVVAAQLEQMMMPPKDAQWRKNYHIDDPTGLQ